MRKFIRGILIFLLPAFAWCIVAIIVMPSLLALQNGPTTEQQIKSSFENAMKKNYRLLIIGNSRAYRGLNPDMFTLNAFNFSHDNDSYNQLYYKLKFLIDNKKQFDYVILGVDYFQFSFKSDTRNYVYADLLGDDYLKDFNNNLLIDKLKLKLEYHLGNVNPKKLLSMRPKKDITFLRENGQYIRPGIAKESDKVVRDIHRLKFQETYFNKIISFCKSKNIKLFLVMLPARPVELDSYSLKQIREFDSFISNSINNQKVFYLNYSKSTEFKIEDYADVTHLNEKAANKFSKMLNDSIMKLIPGEY